MSKLIYKSEKPYTEDLNDLVEDELEKGRGPDKQPRKQRGSLSHIEDQDASDARRKEAKARVNAIVAARTAKMTDAQRAKMRTSNNEKDAKIKANDQKIANHPVKTSKESPTGG